MVDIHDRYCYICSKEKQIYIFQNGVHGKRGRGLDYRAFGRGGLIFGIESYFVPEGAGRALEAIRQFCLRQGCCQRRVDPGKPGGRMTAQE